ncbi:hypothetical protein BDV25DRAFT_5190 [Aspergillus avenaceus]|uniref:Uncharacterized protein n=1 Tax=Aspergillus avenaceus TaxID=36643 RepID=A0A5N6U5T1_ASPAV|nr:hypothetical protein BDV25DRAFT_5190 [Aspergillus avenaceus]
MLDMEVIERTGTGTRETRWKRAFEVVYGLPFEILQQRRRSVSKRIQRVMNIRADIVTAELWAAELNRRRGQALLQLVDDILINWAEDPGCCVETGGVEDELFERVVWVYEGVQDEWFGNVEGCVDSSRSGG